MKRRVRSIVLVACATSITAVAVAAPVRWSVNGHYYQAVSVGTPISWDAARQAAKALGPGWHLATITSAEEDAFVRGLFPGHPFYPPEFWSPTVPFLEFKRGPWIGGYRVFGSETFQWVTGEPVLFTDLRISPRDAIPSPISYLRIFGSTIGQVDWLAYDLSFASPIYSPIAYVAELSAPPANPGLELGRTTVAGCKSVTGRVNISSPAPAGGLVVNLSDTLKSASTPASLTIPAGATSKSFLITTRPVFGMQTGTVTAMVGGKTFRRQLIVRPMGLQSVLSAPTVVRGTKVIGTARLECKAGPGPVTVRLGSNRPEIASPVAVDIVIPQGVQSETFDITTSGVGSVWIFGTANKITQSKSLKVTP
jgi:hypothetical protein